jgi:hypothetical protein
MRAARRRSVANAAQIPSQKELEKIRDQINSSRRTVVWSNRSDIMLSERIKDDVTAPAEEIRPRRIIMDQEPIDIKSPPKASQLISTTALVQDFIGVPSSLSFIR